MSTRGNDRPAVVAAIVAAILYQLTTEVRAVLAGFGQDTPLRLLWPSGSLFPLRVAFGSHDWPLALLGLVVGLVVIVVVVLVLVRVVVSRTVPARGTTFLASWMAVVVGGLVAGIVTMPILLAVQHLPSAYWSQQLAQVTLAPYWGVAVGWVAALAAALSAAPTAAPTHVGNPGSTGSYPGEPGYPATGGQGVAPYPDAQGDPDPSSSPYLSGRPEQPR